MKARFEPLTCGCSVTTDPVDGSPSEIRRCPLHASAPQLLETLEAMLSCCTDDHCGDAIRAEKVILEAKGLEYPPPAFAKGETPITP